MDEAVPAIAQRSFAESFPILSAVIADDVVLARNKENIAHSGLFHDLIKVSSCWDSVRRDGLDRPCE